MSPLIDSPLTTTLSVLALTIFILAFARFNRSYTILTNPNRKPSDSPIPILVQPFTTLSLPWILVRDFVKPVAEWLSTTPPFDFVVPRWTVEWMRRGWLGWNWTAKYEVHRWLGEQVQTRRRGELGSETLVRREGQKGEDLFWIVGWGGERELYVCDKDVVEEVLKRHRSFIKNPAMYGVLEFFGANVNTANGKTWERHRRITVPPFNERNSSLVWDEAGRQARMMLDDWRGGDHADDDVDGKQTKVVRATQDDCMTLALHVLIRAGFGLRYDFAPTVTKARKDGRLRRTKNSNPVSQSTTGLALGQSTTTSTQAVEDDPFLTGTADGMSYRDTVRFVLANLKELVLLNVFAGMGMPQWMISRRVKIVSVVAERLRGQLRELVEGERRKKGKLRRDYDVDESNDEDNEGSNLMSVLVRNADVNSQVKKRKHRRLIEVGQQEDVNDTDGASDQSTDLQDHSDASVNGTLLSSPALVSSPTNHERQVGLTDDEVLGNLFLYSTAGHDTTSNTLCYAIYLLAIYPELQDWLGEEVDKVVGRQGGSGERADWDYNTVFPKLQRCLALMLETLRLYGPVPTLPRYTSTEHSMQNLDYRNTSVPIPPKTNIYLNLTALHTHPGYWSPDPLVFRPSRWIVTNTTTGEKELFQPEAGTYAPWITGPRACPGKKFSQVEFVRVVAEMVSGGRRVEVVPEPKRKTREGGSGWWGGKKIAQDVVTENAEQARARVKRILDEDSTILLTLKVTGAERIGLRWRRDSSRGGGGDGESIQNT